MNDPAAARGLAEDLPQEVRDDSPVTVAAPELAPRIAPADASTPPPRPSGSKPRTTETPVSGARVPAGASEHRGEGCAQHRFTCTGYDLPWRASFGGAASTALVRTAGAQPVLGGDAFPLWGMGRTYERTALMGVPLRGLDPSEPSAPVDFFPVGMLGPARIQHTPATAMPADLLGGTIHYDVARAPEAWTVRAGLLLGLHTRTLGRTLGVDRVPADDVAFGNYARPLPADFPTALEESTPASRERAGESFPSTKTTPVARRAVPFTGFYATLGRTFGRGHHRLGFLSALTYTSSLVDQRSTTRTFSGTPDGRAWEEASTYAAQRGVGTVQWSAANDLTWRAGSRHEVRWFVLYGRRGSLTAERNEGRDRSILSGPIEQHNLATTAASHVLTRLGGHHRFKKDRGPQLDWIASFRDQRLDDPLRRSVTYVGTPEGDLRWDPSGQNSFRYATLDDRAGVGSADLSVPFRVWRKLESLVHLGVRVDARRVGGDGRQFAVRTVSTTGIPPGTGDLLTDATIGGGVGPQPFYFEETTRSTDAWKASHEVYAAHASIELPFSSWAKLVAGLRFEAGFITTERGRMQGGPSGPQAVKLDDYSPLPLARLVLDLAKNHVLVIGGAKSVLRPQVPWLVGSPILLSNPQLRGAEVWHADATWQWTGQRRDLVSASVFYKNVEHAYVWATQPILPPPLLVTNAARAHMVGVSLNVRKDLGLLHRVLEPWSVGADFTYLWSRVEQPGAGPQAGFALVDTFPYVLRSDLTWDDPKRGTRAQLVYALFGPRALERVELGRPQVIVPPLHTVNLALAQRVATVRRAGREDAGLELTFDGLNLADRELRHTYASAPEAVLYQARPGRVFLFGVRYVQ